MTTTIRSTRVRTFAALCAFSLLTVACGDDDDTEASTDDTVSEGDAASTGDHTDYCAAVAEMEESEEFDPAQFERIRETAPDQISEEIDYVADAFIEAEGDFGAALADPQVEEMLGPIEEFEAEHCESGEDEFAVAPENEEYCAAVEELDGQDGPPTEDQLLNLKEIRPDSIGEETDMVADAFIAAGGDMGAVFSDPAVEEAFTAMEEHDAEVCGFETEGEGEDEVATEPLEGAEVIPVTGIDFEFEGIPSEVPAGDVSFEFTNEGEAAHEMVVFKLGEGVDLDGLLASDEEPSEEDAQDIGFTFAPPGEGGVYLNAEGLDAGTYAVVCFIPGPEGKAHHELGMKTTFTVA